MQRTSKKEVPENRVVAVDAAVVTVVIVVVVASIDCAVVVVAFALDNGTILFERYYTKEEADEPSSFTTRIVTKNVVPSTTENGQL